MKVDPEEALEAFYAGARLAEPPPLQKKKPDPWLFYTLAPALVGFFVIVLIARSELRQPDAPRLPMISDSQVRSIEAHSGVKLG